MQPNKRNVLAIVAEMQRRKKSVTPEQVSAIKSNPRTTLDEAITHFMPKINDRQRQQFLAAGADIAKKFERMGDSRLREEQPTLHNLWLNGEAAKPVHSGGNQGGTYEVKLSDMTTRSALLARLNLLRKKRGMEPVKSAGDAAMIKERIDKLGKAIIKDSMPAFKVHPTVVAEGAYKSDIEAQHKTGHTARGKTQAMQKHEKRIERHIEKRTHLDAPKNVPVPIKTKVIAGSTITLAQIAREIDMLPKVARQKARKYKLALSKFEYNKQKYHYVPSNKYKVIAILKGGA